MLISHRFKFIYTKTVKTAGTSVETYFEKFCLPEGAWNPADFQKSEARSPRPTYESETGVIGFRGSETKGQKWYNHMPARRIREQVGEEIWKHYVKFCVVRNPWDKAVSAYEYLGRDYRLPSGLRSAFFRWRHRGLDEEQRRFLHWLQTGGSAGPPIDRDKYVIDGELCLDSVVRFEHLQDDLAQLCQRLGVPWESALLATHKSGYRRKEASVERLFSAPAAKVIERLYAFEIAKFDYRNPSALVGS